MKALILSAGMGSRLGRLTKSVPKPMLSIGGQPILSYTIRQLAYFGFDQIAINLHYQAESIKSYLGDGSQYGVQLTYSFEEELLGTAGALQPLKSYFKDEPCFLVIYGDIITNQNLHDLLEFHLHSQAKATLLVHKRKQSNSIIELDPSGRIKSFIERPEQTNQGSNPNHWVNSGVQILSPHVLELIPATAPADLPRDIYVPFVDQLELYGFPLVGYRCAVDSPDRYNQVCQDRENGLLTFAWDHHQTKK